MVSERARGCCEYCLVPREAATFSLQIDHIIPERQFGPTDVRNLALACKPCNCKKGYSVVRHYYDSGKTVLLFNPRTQVWADHFKLLSSGEIKCLTEVGIATAEMLDFNHETRVVFRERLLANGLLEL